MSLDTRAKQPDIMVDAEKAGAHHIEEAVIAPDQKKIEAKIMRKVDWRLIPILGLLYAVGSLDRSNLSNAKVAGIDRDLGFNIGNRYSVALLVFFITYFLLEIPSTLTLRFIGPKLQLSALASAWGLVMLGQGFSKHWTDIVVCRILIGSFEAGFLPCCIFLLSSWYQRYEVQKRMAAFYIVNLTFTAFGNILAFGIIKLNGAHGIAGWRWIFIIEGALTVGIGLLSYFIILDFPDKILARGEKNYFSQAELEMVLDRVDRDRGDSLPDELTIAKFRRHIMTWQLWVYGFMFLCSSAPAYAFAYFIQTILKGMGYTTAVVFLLCSPPYICACFWTMATAWAADKTQLRMPYMVFNSAVTLTGLLLTAYHKNNAVRYVGIFLGVCGCNANLVTIIAFQSNNVRSTSRRAVASGVQFAFAAIGGVYASTTFLSREAPKYLTGIWATIATQIFLIILVGIMTVYFRRKNKMADTEGHIIQEDTSFRYTF